MKWELKLEQVKQMVGNSNAILYQRVKLLMEIYDDPEYLAFHNGDTDAALSWLDSYLGDYTIEFVYAMNLYKFYPNEEQWSRKPSHDSPEGNLRKMLATMISQQEKERRERTPPRSRRSPIPNAQHDKVLEEKEKLETKARILEEESQLFEEKSETLLRENERLRHEMQELREKIEDLRHKLHRHREVTQESERMRYENERLKLENEKLRRSLRELKNLLDVPLEV